MAALAAPLAEIELGHAGRDPRFRIESPAASPRGGCWCGRPLPEALRPVLLVELPAELGAYRGRPFHSAACAVAYASRAVNRIDATLATIPEGPRAETGRRLRAMLVKLMGELLAFELTWLSA